VHGANRLGTNSLIDIVVFGRAAALRCAETIERGASLPDVAKHAGEQALARLDMLRHGDGGTHIADVRLKMQRAMQECCEVYRTGALLRDGERRIAEAMSGFAEISVSDRSLVWNSELIEAWELGNLLPQATVTVAGALNRQESRGAHSREDFPTRSDDKWMKHTLTWVDASTNGVRLDYRPVHSKTLTNDVCYFPPQVQVR
jgi:succinate dehydrogenase / fumarate reductase, flavoprotein subunit